LLNRLSFFAALLLAITSGASAPSRAPVNPQVTRPKIGQQAPAFTLLDQNRRSVSLTGAAGTKVVLVFYRGYW
jgi:cytochrome oxidase Cu insertion factor (SCO1/SenC/PrrC family)